MHWLQILCSLSIIALSHAKWNITTISPGFLFEPDSNIELISGSWKFLTNINLTTYYSQIEYAEEIVIRTSNFCLSLQNSEMAVNFGNPSSICKGFIAELNEELAEIKSHNKYISIHQNKRSKRGLFNVIGHGFKFLFGTMDASDAKLIESQINDFEKTSASVQSNLEKQSTILKYSVEKLNETIDTMNKHTELVYNLTLDVGSMNRIIDRQIIYNQIRFLFDELSSYAEVIISKIRREQIKLFDILFSTRRGLIHDSLLNPEEMMSELQNIQLMLRNLRFPLEINKINLYKIINLSEFIVFESNNLIIFTINVPLITHSIYTAYSIVNAPRQIDDENFSFTQYDFDMIAVNSEKNRYFTINSEQPYSGCEMISDDVQLCKQPDHIYKTNSNPICEISTFAGVPKKCREITKNIKDEIWISLRKKFNYLFIIPHAISIQIVCQFETFNTHINGTGILSTDGCTFETPLVILPGTEIYKTNVNTQIRMPEMISFPSINSSPTNRSIISRLEYMKFINYDSKVLSENNLNNKLETSHILMIIYVIVSSFAISLLCYFAIWLWRGGLKNQKRQTEES